MFRFFSYCSIWWSWWWSITCTGCNVRYSITKCGKGINSSWGRTSNNQQWKKLYELKSKANRSFTCFSRFFFNVFFYKKGRMSRRRDTGKENFIYLTFSILCYLAISFDLKCGHTFRINVFFDSTLHPTNALKTCSCNIIISKYPHTKYSKYDLLLLIYFFAFFTSECLYRCLFFVHTILCVPHSMHFNRYFSFHSILFAPYFFSAVFAVVVKIINK